MNVRLVGYFCQHKTENEDLIHKTRTKTLTFMSIRSICIDFAYVIFKTYLLLLHRIITNLKHVLDKGGVVVYRLNFRTECFETS